MSLLVGIEVGGIAPVVRVDTWMAGSPHTTPLQNSLVKVPKCQRRIVDVESCAKYRVVVTVVVVVGVMAVVEVVEVKVVLVMVALVVSSSLS